MFYLLQAGITTNSTTSIYVAIISASTAILVGFGTILFKYHLDKKDKRVKEDNRLNTLLDTFFGNVIQGDCEYWCELTITKAKKNIIEGTMTIFYGAYMGHPATSQNMEVSGEFTPDDLLALIYRNVKKSNKQTGVLFLQYLPDGETIIGEFMGFGPISRDFEKCKGKLSLKRKHKK